MPSTPSRVSSPSVSLPQAPASFLPPGFSMPFPPSSACPPVSSVSSGVPLLGSSPLVALQPSSGFPLSSAFSAALSCPPLPVPGLSSSSALPSSSSLSSGGTLGFAAVADPVAPSAVPVATVSSSLFRPFDVPSAPRDVAGSSIPQFGSASLPLHFGDAPLLSASAPLGSASIPVAPPPSEAPRGAPFRQFMPGPSSYNAPPHSSFAFLDDVGFDPDLGDPSAPEPEAPLPSSVPDSVREEIRRIYAYVVSLFPQAADAPSAPPPPHALFEEFFAASPSPHRPVFLTWLERVRTALAEADSRLASLLAASRADPSILPQRMTQYAVHGEFAAGAAVPVNPSLLSMFERSLRPSLQLGISLREAALLESSSRFHSFRSPFPFHVASFGFIDFCSPPGFLSF